MTSKKQKRKERADLRKISQDPFRKKDLTEKDISFNNRQVKLTTTMDIKKFIKEHIVWCPTCNPMFTSMIMHAKTTDNKKLKDECIKQTQKIFGGNTI